MSMPTALIESGELAKRLTDERLRIIDLRGSVLPPTDPPPHYRSHRAEYDRGHIPGALFLSWHDELNQAPHTRLLPVREFEALMSRLGVSNNSEVVAYDDAGGLFAARLWWNLRYLGHGQVRVLNGGWQKWVAEERPTTNTAPSIKPSVFRARPQPAWRSDAEAVLAAIDSPTVLLDTRSPSEFAGKAARRGRSGHIPSARNLPRSELVSADGRLKSPAALRALLAEKGITPESEVIAYCNSGVSASYGLLAMHEAGIHRASNYDFSWNEWGSDAETPIATGE